MKVIDEIKDALNRCEKTIINKGIEFSSDIEREVDKFNKFINDNMLAISDLVKINELVEEFNIIHGTNLSIFDGEPKCYELNSLGDVDYELKFKVDFNIPVLFKFHIEDGGSKVIPLLKVYGVRFSKDIGFELIDNSIIGLNFNFKENEYVSTVLKRYSDEFFKLCKEYDFISFDNELTNCVAKLKREIEKVC